MDSSNDSLTPADKSLLKRIKGVIAAASLLQGDLPLIIAVSGGPDSLCLLHVISSLFPATERIAVYVDHGLRPLETAAEVELVQKQAALCSARFIKVPVNVQQEKEERKCSLEEAARNLRYRALEKIRREFRAQAITVGHTADDQAEEVLIRLIRGSGSGGLSGMQIRNGHIIRPLLHETKEKLSAFLTSRNIPFCEDSSNRDRRFLRNRIRLDLLPKLEQEYNRSMRQTLLRTAAILGEEDSLLGELTDSAFQEMTHRKGALLLLRLSAFSAAHPAIQRRVLEKICWQMASRPSFKKIAALQRLGAAGEGREVHLARGLRAVRQQETVVFCYPSGEKGYRGTALLKKDFPPLTIPGPGRYLVPELKRELQILEGPPSPEALAEPGQLLLDGAAIRFPLTLRSPLPGERFHPSDAPGRKKISRFLSDRKIPALERHCYPVLLSGSTIIAIVGLRIDHVCRVRSQTRQLLTVAWTEREPGEQEQTIPGV